MSRPPCIALVSSTIDVDYLLPAFQAQFPGADLRCHDPRGDRLGERADIDVVVCWAPPPGLLATLPNLRLVQSLGAGMDHLTSDPDLPRVPVCRIVDSGMAGGMTAYVAWAVINHQRKLGAMQENSRRAVWDQLLPVIHPKQHRVGIAGLGTLGLAAAKALLAIGYPVRGWSRSPKAAAELPEGIETFHGEDQRAAFLSGCDTLVCLLPLTDETQGVLNRRLFDQLPHGAHLVNAGRGAHLVEADLLAALDDGRLGFATLDAFETEPLPGDHPFWRHPRVIVTPHIATRTDPATIARQTQQNLALLDQPGAALPAMDFARGY